MMLCRYCDKMYKSRSGLNDQEMQHTNEAQFHCCGKLFFSHSHIVRHMLAYQFSSPEPKAPEPKAQGELL